MKQEINNNQADQIGGHEPTLSEEVAQMLGENPTTRGLNNIRVAVAWELASSVEVDGFHLRRVRNILKEAVFGLAEGRQDGMPEEFEAEYAQLLDFYTQHLILSMIQE